MALDCEMIGVGPMGEESMLARVSVVNYFGAVLLDEFVQQKERVTDWRTQWSGIRAKDLINGDFHFSLFFTDLRSPRPQRSHSRRFRVRCLSSQKIAS